MKRIILNITFCIIAFIANAQIKISGTLVNNQGQNLYGNLILLNNQEKAIAFYLVENGNIKSELINSDTIRLKIVSTNYSSWDTVIFVNSSAIYLGKIQLQDLSKSIKAVQIKASKTLFEKSIDGSIINIENTILSKSSNSAEILAKTPGVTISGNKVNIFGKGESIIIVNGKETTMESFKTIAPADIRAIEIITNPSAKFDAKGKAIIVVRLKKSLKQGMLVTLTDNVTKNIIPDKSATDYLFNTASINLNYRKNKWNATLYYANDFGKNWSENNYTVLTRQGTESYFTKSYYNESEKPKNHAYKVGLSFDINEKSSISAQYDGLTSNINLDVLNNGDYSGFTPLKTYIRMTNDALTQYQNHSLNLNYNLKIDTLGSSFFIGGQYNHFTNILLDHITERFSNDAGRNDIFNRINDGNNSIGLSTFQIDYSEKKGKFLFDLGSKYSHTVNTGKINFYSKTSQESEYNSNPILANSTEYSETIFAVYGIAKYKIKKWSFTAGLRTEASDVLGKSLKLNQNIIDADYVSIFPSAMATMTINDNWNTTFSYSRKINRPIYQDLDPFLWYLDSLTSIQGNSSLTPEFIHQFEANMSFKSFTFRTSLGISENTIWPITRQGISGPNSTVFVKENLQRSYNGLVALDIPYEYKIYNCFNTIAVNYQKLVDSRPDINTGESIPQLYIYSYHQFNIPKWCSIDISWEYYGRGGNGIGIRDPYYYISIGATKNFFKEKLNASVLFNDVFRTALLQGERNIGQFKNTYAQRFSLHYFRLSLVYKFGFLKDFKYKNKGINDKEKSRIKGL